MTPTEFAAAFGCPLAVAELATSYPTPMLRAIAEMGPARVHWAHKPHCDVGRCWSLDGKLVGLDAILSTAKAIRVQAASRSASISAGMSGELTAMHQRILDVLSTHPKLTYAEIGKMVGSPPGSISSAVFSLRQKGYQIPMRHDKAPQKPYRKPNPRALHDWRKKL